MTQTITGYQRAVDAIVDQHLESELAAAMRRKLNRLAKAQTIVWCAASPKDRQKALDRVDALEAGK